MESLTLINAGLGWWRAYVRKYKVMIVSELNNLSCGPGWEGKRGPEKAGSPGENAQMDALDDPIVSSQRMGSSCE